MTNLYKSQHDELEALRDDLVKLRVAALKGEEARFLLQQLWFSLNFEARDRTPPLMKEQVTAMISDVGP